MRRLMIICLLFLMITAPLYAQDNTLTPYEIALQRIEAARDRNATQLYLADLGLTEVPSEIGQLSDLIWLSLSENQLTTLPPEIGQLNNLRMLSLSRNQLILLPPEIGQLSNLQALYLHHNELATLPPEIGQLSNLRSLDVNSNQLTTLPPEIGQLRNLCILSLIANNLQHLQPTIGNLNRLLQHEKCFWEGDISGLYLDGNPFISPPPEVVEQGTVAVLEYLRNQVWYHTQRLIIGVAGGVGLFALLLLGFRWKQRGGRKSKQKRGES